MNNRYDSLNGLRAYCAIGIVIMHVMTNLPYTYDGLLYERVITSFADFVFLFMIISSFSMCCGYYDKIKQNKISFNEFYNKRYLRILPFFAFVSLLELLISFNLKTLYEVFANCTLLFAFLPSTKISVIGVGWYLGVVFAYYILFPFFVYLIWTKKRAWISFAISIIYHYLCNIYFISSRTNIIYCAPFFLLGGLIYLYREDIELLWKKYKNKFNILLILLTSSYYFLVPNLYVFIACLIIFMCFALSNNEHKLLNNEFTKFISNISLEIYLSHMIIFRILEKLQLNQLFNNGHINLITISILTIVGSIIFIKSIELIRNKFISKLLFIKRRELDANC